MSEAPTPKAGNNAPHEETIALSAEELGILSKSSQHEQTMAMTPEELGLSKTTTTAEHEATMALTPAEMGISKPSTAAVHEATMALTPEESGIETPSAASDHEATVALSPEELGIISKPEAEHYEATMALSREELGADPSAQSYQATVALSKAELLSAPLTDSPQVQSAPLDYKKLVSQSTQELLKEARQASAPADQKVSDLERQCYFDMVKTDHPDDKYALKSMIVAGGMGAVYKAVDLDLQRISAMKMILPGFKHNREALTDFITEAKVTGLLEHPNIIPVHDLGLLPDSGIFFTMKLVRGEDLRSILHKIEAETPEYVEKYNTYTLLSLFRKVCDAVSYSHSFNILHRDIKPHNIMVGPYGEVLLMDWGISLYIGSDQVENEFFPQDYVTIISTPPKEVGGPIKGSPAYMSPEQIAGDPYQLSKESDIFLLGATLYHIFTLRAPYTGENIREIAQKALSRDLIPPQERNSGVQIPEELCRIMLKAMAPEKKDRYADAESLSEDIDALISGKWSQQVRKTFAPGELLMKEGDAGDEAYLILDGKIQVVKETAGRKIMLGTLEKGAIVGEMSLISAEMRTASVEALENTSVAVLTKDIVSQNLKKLPPYMEKIVSSLTQRLQIANADIHPYAKSDCTYIVLKYLNLWFTRQAWTGAAELSAPFSSLVNEIAEDLGLSAARVEAVLQTAASEGKIQIAGARLLIPYLNALSDAVSSFKPLKS